MIYQCTRILYDKIPCYIINALEFLYQFDLQGERKGGRDLLIYNLYVEFHCTALFIVIPKGYLLNKVLNLAIYVNYPGNFENCLSSKRELRIMYFLKYYMSSYFTFSFYMLT